MINTALYSSLSSNRLYGIALIYIVLLVLGACASKVPSDRYNFSGVQSQDGSKRFVYGYSVRRSAPGAPLAVERDGAARNAVRPRRLETVDFSAMRKELDIYMNVNPYCSEGYFVYNETFDGGEYLLHGECQESVADE